jgi:hypothetical protein
MADAVARMKLPAVTANPPASAETFTLAEKELDIAMPKHLRWIYENVGDGGFGPGYGLFPLLHDYGAGFSHTIVSETLDKRELSADGDYNWSNNYIVICTYGCTFSACVDASIEDLPVFFVEDSEGIVGELQSTSLLLWLEAWLDGNLSYYGAILK